jgi:rhomboid protease GluP
MNAPQAGRNSLLCPRCRKLISGDESRCPYCGLGNPGSSWRTILGRISANSIDVVKIIIAVNVVYFIVSLLLNPSTASFSFNPFTLLSPSERSLFALGATGTVPIAGYGRWWTMISASFLHGGILHIFFNMAALSQLGPFVLVEFGLSRFLIIYLTTGVGGFLLSYIAGVPFTIGASASICGLIGAILYFGRTRGGSYGEVIYRQALGWIVGLAVFGLLLPGINNWAHGGGLVSGVLMGFLLGYRDQSTEAPLHLIIAAACVMITVTILLWAFGQALYLLLL